VTTPENLQNSFLQALCQNKTPVSVFLVNGIKLQGHIETFDDHTITLLGTGQQMIYKHAISTILPSHSYMVSNDQK
jgi:host factor-I protein